MAMALNFNTCLSELRMRANSAGDETACFMAEAIKRQGTLLPRAAALRFVRAQEVLDFVLRAPVRQIHAVKGNLLFLMRLATPRRKVDLAENGVSDVGAQAIVRALRQSSSHMTHLDLANNDIDIDNFDAISKHMYIMHMFAEMPGSGILTERQTLLRKS